ncbi:Gldg family protein [Novosphingobium sp.]|uniref:Gldg family protein n=1 Tax=Novosphingobium sp. TaxID=1874826 RepID=UPI00286E6432|nr:DUF4350 domain-containing protein [Novosphingobium sp.]
MAALASSLLLGACAGQARTSGKLGLMTSLPILWTEEPSIGAMLSKAEAPPHWARGVLEARGNIVPLDRIASQTLRGVDLAVLAQPRPLSPEEMAALDRWVRGGGKLLLFADPMLTAHSIFPVGDKRRPQAIAMVDPLLAHWGLELGFDDAAEEVEATVQAAGLSLPVNLPGTLKASNKRCSVDPSALVATCRIGRGRAVIVADAALLESEGITGPEARKSALAGVLALVENRRESTSGKIGVRAGKAGEREIIPFENNNMLVSPKRGFSPVNLDRIE